MHVIKMHLIYTDNRLQRIKNKSIKYTQLINVFKSFFRDIKMYFLNYIYRETGATKGNCNGSRVNAWAEESRDHWLVDRRDKKNANGIHQTKCWKFCVGLLRWLFALMHYSLEETEFVCGIIPEHCWRKEALCFCFALCIDVKVSESAMMLRTHKMVLVFCTIF